MCLGWAANTSATGSSSHSGAASIAAASSSWSVRKHAAGQVDSNSEDDFDHECAQLINSELSSEWKQELHAYLEDCRLPSLSLRTATPLSGGQYVLLCVLYLSIH